MKLQVCFVLCVIAYVAASTVPIHPTMFAMPKNSPSAPATFPEESQSATDSTSNPTSNEAPNQTPNEAPNSTPNEAPNAAPNSTPNETPNPMANRVHSQGIKIPTPKIRDGLIYTAGAMILKIIKRLPRSIRSENVDN